MIHVEWGDCPSYDGVPSYGGPCNTCRGVEGRCPMDDKPSNLKVYFNSFIFTIEENNEFIRKGYEPMPMRIPNAT